MMEIGFLVGWLGVAFGLCVPIPQLIKIFKTKSLADISICTYIFLVCCLACYLIHAVHIRSPVFTTAQAINLVTNGTILILLLRKRREVNRVL